MDAQPLQESNPPAGVDRSAPAAAGGDWRAQLRPEARSRIANRIHKALLKCLPVESSEAMDELKKISVRFEEKIYTAATSQPDYMRKISLKMLGMEMKTQPARANAQVNPNQYNPNQVIEPGVVIVMDDLDDHVDGTNSRLQCRQKRLAVLNKRAKGGCCYVSSL